MLRTKTKLDIARIASVGLRRARGLVGLDEFARVTRGGITWNVDLKEGIDLAIYLKCYQSIPRYVREHILRRGMIAMDIGANVGAFTLPLAKDVGGTGKVLAIEATDFAYQKLRLNLSLNPDLSQRVTPVQAFLRAADTTSAPDAVYSSWRVDRARRETDHPQHGGSGMSTDGAANCTLDDLLQSDPRYAFAEQVEFIKLDVDGHETSVLRGAHRILGSARPTLYIEIAPYVQNERSGGLEQLLAELAALGYRLEHAENGRPIPMDAETVNRLIPYGAGIDVLCRPN